MFWCFCYQKIDCACEGKWLGGQGCVIKKPPPPGYKCVCMNNGEYGGYACAGYPEKCKSKSDPGCNGCSEMECCSENGTNGDCKGYIDEEIIDLPN